MYFNHNTMSGRTFLYLGPHQHGCQHFVVYLLEATQDVCVQLFDDDISARQFFQSLYPDESWVDIHFNPTDSVQADVLASAMHSTEFDLPGYGCARLVYCPCNGNPFTDTTPPEPCSPADHVPEDELGVRE